MSTTSPFGLSLPEYASPSTPLSLPLLRFASLPWLCAELRLVRLDLLRKRPRTGRCDGHSQYHPPTAQERRGYPHVAFHLDSSHWFCVISWRGFALFPWFSFVRWLSFSSNLSSLALSTALEQKAPE